MGLRSFKYFTLLVRGPTLNVRVYRRQILTSKVGSRAEGVKTKIIPSKHKIFI